MKKAKIEDHDVPNDVKGPRYLAVLRLWSEKVSADFNERNTKQVRNDAPLEQQVQAVVTGLHTLANAFNSFTQAFSRRDEQNMQMIAILSKQISSLSEEENERLKRNIGESPPCRRRPGTDAAVTETVNTAVTGTTDTAVTENAATESPDSATMEIPDSTEAANSAEATNETGVAVALLPAKKTKTSVDG
jgi:hypothetical protein